MKNITKSNLAIILKQLDDACGSIDNAVININTIKKIPQEIKDSANNIDFSTIISVKNQVEELLENMYDLEGVY